MNYKYVQSVIDNIMKQRYLVAFKNGVIKSYPFALIGSLLLLLICPPLPQNMKIVIWLLNYKNIFIKLYYLSMGLMSLYTVFSMGYYLAEEYQLDTVQSGVFCVFSFLVSLFFMNELSLEVLCYALFIGIMTTIITVEILRITQNIKKKNILPKCVPSAVSASIMDLFPCFCLFIIFGFIFPLCSFIDSFAIVMKHLLLMLDSLFVILIIIFLITFYWIKGIHGASVISMILRPFWICMLQYNGYLLIQGSHQFFVSPEPFLQWFVWIGGSGTTLGLSFLFRYTCSSKYCKEVGRTSWISSIFNINEPIIFGTPIVSNSLFIVPFIATPMICASIAWYAITHGIIMPMRIMAIWTLPSPIGAFIATVGDYRAVLLNILLIFLSIIIYYPFVKIYDSRLLKEEENE